MRILISFLFLVILLLVVAFGCLVLKVIFGGWYWGVFAAIAGSYAVFESAVVYRDYDKIMRIE